MSENILVIPADKLSAPFIVTIEQAQRITSSGSGIWKGRKTVYLTPDRNKKVSWTVRQSGYAGPLVMQVVT